MSIIHERWGASFKEEVDASGIVRCDYVLYCWSAEGSLGSFKLNSCDLPVCSTSFEHAVVQDNALLEVET